MENEMQNEISGVSRRNSKRNFWSVPTKFKTKFFGRQNEIQNEIPFKGIFQLKAAKTVMGLTKYYPFLLPPQTGKICSRKGSATDFFEHCFGHFVLDALEFRRTLRVTLWAA